MADNEFLQGVRVEQFIKSNNEQIKETLGDLKISLSKGFNSLMSEQKKVASALLSIDKTSKSTSDSISKILSHQEKLLKGVTDRKDILTNTSMKSLIKEVTKEKIKTVTGASTKDFFKRDNLQEESLDKLDLISKSLGMIYNQGKDKKKGKGLLGWLGLLGTIGAGFAGAGLIGFLLTGKKELLNNVWKGGRYMLKGLWGTVKTVMPSFLKGILGIGPDAAKAGGGLMKALGFIGEIGKTTARLFKMFKGFGFKGLTRGVGTVLKGLGKGGGKAAVKKIPGLGAIMGLVFGVQKFSKGDIVGGLLEISSGAASMIPGFGTAASIAIDLYSLKRDLTITPNEIAEQRQAVTDPIGSVRTLMQGRRDRQSYEASTAADPSFQRGISRLRSLSMDQRRGFSEWQQRRYGSTLNVSDPTQKAQYEARVEEYRRSLGVGGGGFQLTALDIPLDEMPEEGGRRWWEFWKKDPTTPVAPTPSSPLPRDDNWSASGPVGYQRSLQWLRANREGEFVKLTPGERYQADLLGIQPDMRQRFFAMAEEYNRNTGGFFSVNSGRRSGGGGSVHDHGYAIDVNTVDGSGRWGYVPDDLLSKYGFHKPLLHYRDYGGPVDEPWHIEPYPGEEAYGGARNTLALAAGQPFRRGVLLRGGQATYANNVGGGGFNLPNGTVGASPENNNMSVTLSDADIEKLATAFGRQIRENTPVQKERRTAINVSTPRQNL